MGRAVGQLRLLAQPAPVSRQLGARLAVRWWLRRPASRYVNAARTMSFFMGAPMLMQATPTYTLNCGG